MKSRTVSLVSTNPRKLINQINYHSSNGYKLVSIHYKIWLIFVRYTALMVHVEDDLADFVEIDILKISEKS
jgi:hypothetical protein